MSAVVPHSQRAAIIRKMASEGAGRAAIAAELGVRQHVVDRICTEHGISTNARGLVTSSTHPGWGWDGDAQRAWFIKMNKRFGAALRAELSA